MAKRAVFTALLGEYEQLTELSLDKESDVDYLLFTDRPNLVSNTWQVILVDNPFPLDLSRSQRAIKIQMNELLEAYDETLYIDNNVELLVPVTQILDSWLANHDVAFAEHSDRETLRAEFQEVLRARLDTGARILDQLNAYEILYPELLEIRPLWGGMFARRKTEATLKFNKIWYQHVLRYSRRDQLSLPIALHLVNLTPNRLTLNFHGSELHKRHIEIRQISRKDSRASERDYYREIERMKMSFSWRITKPIRFVQNRLKRKR